MLLIITMCLAEVMLRKLPENNFSALASMNIAQYVFNVYILVEHSILVLFVYSVCLVGTSCSFTGPLSIFTCNTEMSSCLFRRTLH